MIFNGHIKPNGVLIIHNRTLFDNAVGSMARENDVKVTIEVKKAKVNRSLMQNAYYFGVCVSMVQERLRDLGHDITKEDTHNLLRGRFLFTELIDDKTGEVVKIPKSTKNLTKTEFMDYIEDIKRFGAEVLDIVIPDAGEQLKIE
jgi:hypothetical protein